MDKRLAVINIIVEDNSVAAYINELLHEFSEFIIGRFGIPYNEKGVAVICVVMDAPTATASALSGKLGMLDGVKVKTMTAKG